MNFTNFFTPLILFLDSPLSFALFVGFIGLFVGSFANVVVYRLRHGGSIGMDRSRCPNCKHVLGASDLVPVFSWIFLRGKCRYCAEGISLQYPVVELLFGAMWFAAAFLLHHPSLGWQSWTYFLFILFLVSALLIIAVYDALYYEIPDQVSLPMIGLSLLAFILPQTPQVWDAVFGSVLIYTFFYLQILLPVFLYSLREKNFKELGSTVLSYFLFPVWIVLSLFLPEKLIKKIPLFADDEESEIPVWIGGGDLRLAFVMGLVLGLQKSLVALLIAYVSGAVIGLLLILLGKKDRKSMMPFGPFLIIGTLISLFYGQAIWAWYWGMLVF